MMQDVSILQHKILSWTKKEDKIRAVLLNGSRANPNIVPDVYQDFDLVFIVDDMSSFLHDRTWFENLGTPVLQQLPDEMELGKDSNLPSVTFGFLTIFKEGYRIDLTLFPKEKMISHFKHDSLTEVWLDKDQLFTSLPESSDQDYHIQKPNQREFTEVCNEFWWCVVNVAKGLKREEILYAKDMLENVVRPMFTQMIAWKVGIENNFTVSAGKSGKFLVNYLPISYYHILLKTYSDAELNNNWDALFLLMQLFRAEQEKTGALLHFSVALTEADNAFELVK